jgi:large subunit ribosomal protein L30e
MATDISRSLKTALATGKVKFGLAETRKAMKSGSAKLVVVSENCPDGELLSGRIGIKRVVFPGDNIELGAACGKPFAVSSLVILDQGSSDILSAQ